MKNLFMFFLFNSHAITAFFNLSQTDLEKAGFLLSEALDEDEQGSINEAIDLYSEAVDLCLKIVSYYVLPVFQML